MVKVLVLKCELLSWRRNVTARRVQGGISGNAKPNDNNAVAFRPKSVLSPFVSHPRPTDLPVGHCSSPTAPLTTLWYVAEVWVISHSFVLFPFLFYVLFLFILFGNFAQKSSGPFQKVCVVNRLIPKDRVPEPYRPYE